MSALAIDPDTTEEAAESATRLLIRSYVLETLTTGMYVEPRDCLREYVQNALDAIEAGRQSKLLGAEEGTVEVTLSHEDSGSLLVRDDGPSLTPEQVWDTMTSIGASRKSSGRQAGFRGIGRLAGIAYCDKLEFRCKASGYETMVVIVYDCARIRGFLSQSVELESVFSQCVSKREEVGWSPAEHFTEVAMIGLAEAPPILKDVVRLHEYLRSVAPLAFRDGFLQGAEIMKAAQVAGMHMPYRALACGHAWRHGRGAEALRKVDSGKQESLAVA